MNNFLELCEKRQSCRSYDSSRAVEREKLLKILEAGRLTPSACNTQPWSFVVVENPEVAAKVSEACQQIGANAFTSDTRAFIVVLEERVTLMPKIRSLVDSQYFAKHDLGAAVASMCYQATELGLGTCILGLFDREKLSKDLDIPYHYRFDTVIAVGYPKDEKIRTKHRKSIEELARFV